MSLTQTELPLSECRQIVPLKVPWFVDAQSRRSFSALSKLADSYGQLLNSIDKVTVKIVEEHFKEELAILMDLAQTLEELNSRLGNKSSRVTFNVTGINPLLFETLSQGKAKAQIDEIRLKQLFRALAQQFHPDKETGDVELFRLARVLYEAKDIEGLYLLWISKEEALDTPEAIRRCIFIQKRYDALQAQMQAVEATSGYKVVGLVVSGRQTEAKALVREMLFTRIKALATEVYGLEQKIK